MQTAIVVMIIAAAAFHVARVFYKKFKQKPDCSCGCSSCTITDACKPVPTDVQTDPTSASQKKTGIVDHR